VTFVTFVSFVAQFVVIFVATAQAQDLPSLSELPPSHSYGGLAEAFGGGGRRGLDGADATPTVLVSRQLAEARQLRVGSLVRFAADPSGANVREFRVAGIYEPVADPMRINSPRREARFHLPDLLAMLADPQEPLSMETVDTINVALVDPAEARVFAREVASRVPGIVAWPAREAASKAGPFVVLERFHLAIALVTVMASTVFLLALTVMLVDERRETVGILRLIGLTSRRILVQVFAEGLIIAAAGSLFGLALAVASQDLINRFFQWRYDTALVFVRVTPEVAWRCLAIAVPLGALASVAASWALLRSSTGPGRGASLLSVLRR
jgi:putative ABC transport system permease protein